MNFNPEIMKSVLSHIEYRSKFEGDNLDEPQHWNMKYCISISELIKLYSNNYDVNDIRYCIWILRELGYIDFSRDTITKITPKGYKFMLDLLHNLDCKY